MECRTVWLSVKGPSAKGKSVVLEGLWAEKAIRLFASIGVRPKGVKGLGKGERRGSVNA